jgi:predicted transposase YbfD/YdcC
VLAGARSFTAIGEWAANASQQVLTALGVGACPPSESCLRRTLQNLEGDRLDAVLGEWAAGHTGGFGVRRAVAVDGKTVRGSRGAQGPARHLMAVVDHHAGVVIGQVNVPGKTNEIPMFSQLCDQITDLEQVVVTADAMHCQKDHADYLVLQRGAHYVLTVKGNQPALRHQLKALPWKDVPVGHTSTSRGHGRVEKRALKVVTISASPPGSCSRTLSKPSRSPAAPASSTQRNGGPKWSTPSPACPPRRPPTPSSRPGSAATGA